MALQSVQNPQNLTFGTTLYKMVLHLLAHTWNRGTSANCQFFCCSVLIHLLKINKNTCLYTQIQKYVLTFHSGF